MKTFFRILAGFFAFATALAFSNARAEDLSSIYTAALEANLAPACGVRPGTWSQQVSLGAESAVQAVLRDPGMFPSRDELDTIDYDETLVDASLANGKYIFSDYGKAACKEFMSADVLQDADTLASNAPLSGEAGGWISNEAIQVAWAVSRADVAYACKFRSQSWLKTADTVLLKTLLAAAYISPQPMDDSQKETAVKAANKLLTFDRTFAATEILSARQAACKAIRTSPEIAADDAAIKNWEAQKDPWAGAGGN